jgi:RimJ/RimL family protein N-acetyltransferase
MNIQRVILEGRALRLEPLADQHAGDLVALATPDQFQFTFGPAEYTIAGFRATFAARARAGFVLWAIIQKETGRAIGYSGYLDIQPEHRALEIGSTWIARAFQGTTVNPESKYLLLRHAFEDQAAVRVQFKTGHFNLHSQRAIEKLGAIKEGILRNHMILPDGSARHSVIYSIIDSEWPTIRAQLEARLGYVP